jgi:hypothetical protein
MQMQTANCKLQKRKTAATANSNCKLKLVYNDKTAMGIEIESAHWQCDVYCVYHSIAKAHGVKL